MNQHIARTLAAATLLGLAAPSNAQQVGTYLQGGDPFGIDFHDADTGWHTADGGLIRWTENASDPAGPTWNQAATPDVRVRLRGIQMVDSLNGYTVGEEGVVLRTTDGGRNWTQVSVVMSPALTFLGQPWPSVPANLHHCFFFDAVYGFVVGDDMTVSYTIDAGQTWTPAATFGIQVFFDNTHETPFDAYDLHFFDADNGIMVLDEGWIARTTDGGQSWSSVSGMDELDLLPGVLPACNSGITNLEMWSIDVLDDGNPTTQDPAVIAGGFGHNDGFVFYSADSGQSWTAENCLQSDFTDTTGGGSGSNAHCAVTRSTQYGAVALAADTALSLGYGRSRYMRQTTPAPGTATWFTGFDSQGNPITTSCPSGSAWWNRDNAPAPANPPLNVPLASPPMSWAERLDGDTVFTTGQFGIIERVEVDTSGPKTVAQATQLNSTQHGRIFAAAFTGGGLGFQGGQKSQILRTQDGGLTVERVYSSPATNNPYVLGMDVADNGSWVIAVGTEAPVVNVQGGDVGQWVTSPLPGPATTLEAAQIIGSTGTAYVAGANGRVYRTDNQGQTWVTRHLPVSKKVLALEFFTADIGLAVGVDASCHYTLDGGQSWSTRNMPTSATEDLTGAAVSFPHVLVVGSEGGIYYADVNQGVNFSAIQSGLPEQATASFLSVDAVPGTLDFWLVGMEGFAMRFDGATWSLPRPMTVADLNTVTCVDASTVMVSTRRNGLVRF